MSDATLGSPPPASAVRGEWVTLAVAAARAGLSIDTVRRRVRRGEWPSRTIVTRYGPTYQVSLDRLPAPSPPGEPLAQRRQQARGAGVSEGQAFRDLVRLVEKLQQENQSLATQVGYLKAQLELSRDAMRRLSDIHAPSSAAPPKPPVGANPGPETPLPARERLVSAIAERSAPPPGPPRRQWGRS